MIAMAEINIMELFKSDTGFWDVFMKDFFVVSIVLGFLFGVRYNRSSIESWFWIEAIVWIFFYLYVVTRNYLESKRYLKSIVYNPDKELYTFLLRVAGAPDSSVDILAKDLKLKKAKAPTSIFGGYRLVVFQGNEQLFYQPAVGDWTLKAIDDFIDFVDKKKIQVKAN